MASLTYAYIGILVLLGLIGYFTTGSQSVTALIPAFFGVVVFIVFLTVSGLAGPSALKWTMVVLAVVGFAATVSGIPKVIQLLGGGEVARPAAVISQTIMAVVSFVYGLLIVLSGRSPQA